jgi:predicted amidohydrolase
MYQGSGPTGDIAAIGTHLEKLSHVALRAKALGAHLLSFPELYLSGYNTTDGKTAHDLADHILKEGILNHVAEVARREGLSIICPYPESAWVAGARRYYDSIAVFGPKGEIQKNYRKTHLWGGDERHLWSFGHVHPEEGEAFTVFKVNGVNVGVLNCYEAEFPELSRILALKGAQLVVIPTAADQSMILRNGEKTQTPYPDAKFLIRANAYQNEMFCAYANRRGAETLGGREVARYLGNSCLYDPHGNALLPETTLPTSRNDQPGSGWDEDMLLIADCVPSYYGPTHPETLVGDRAKATHYFEDRRRDLYAPLTAKTYVDPKDDRLIPYPDEPV